MIHASQVRSLFLDGNDSFEISRRLNIPEADVLDLLQDARMTGFKNASYASPERFEEARNRNQRKKINAAHMQQRSKVTVTLVKVRGVE